MAAPQTVGVTVAPRKSVLDDAGKFRQPGELLFVSPEDAASLRASGHVLPESVPDAAESAPYAPAVATVDVLEEGAVKVVDAKPARGKAKSAADDAA